MDEVIEYCLARGRRSVFYHYDGGGGKQTGRVRVCAFSVSTGLCSVIPTYVTLAARWERSPEQTRFQDHSVYKMYTDVGVGWRRYSRNAEEKTAVRASFPDKSLIKMPISGTQDHAP